MQTHTDKYGREVTVTDGHRYRLKNTGDSSQKYGPCGVCERHCSEVWVQSVEREFAPGRYAHETHRFGHKDCLVSQRIGG